MKTFRIGASAGYSFAYLGKDGDLEGYLDTIDRIGQLGFELYAIEILTVDKARLFAPTHRQAWRERAEAAGITYTDFNCFIGGIELACLDPQRNQRGIELIQLSVQAAKELGINMISIASGWPEELIENYRPEYFNAPPATSRWQKDLSWSSYWTHYVDNIKRAFDIVKQAGMTLVLEARANTAVGNLDALLRLHDAVNDDDFGGELDVMHIAFVQEDLATTIRRAGKALKLLQVCDSDGVSMEHMAVGEGKMDFGAMLQALNDIDYDGILQLEVYGATVEGRVDEAHVKSKHILMELQG